MPCVAERVAAVICRKRLLGPSSLVPFFIPTPPPPDHHQRATTISSMSSSALAAPESADARAVDPMQAPPPPQKSKSLRWTHDIFTDPQSLLLVLVLVPLAVLLGPHAMWFLRPPTLPETWVRPATLGGLYASALPLDQRAACGNTWASLLDPYGRPGHVDRKVQVLAYCEDAAPLPGGGAALLSCDPGRRRWNTVMGPLEEPEPRGALWVLPTWANVSEKLPKPTLLPVYNLPVTKQFHPLGVHLFQDTLFVVNHAADATTIEVFALAHDGRSGRGHGDGVGYDEAADGSHDHGYSATWMRTIAHPLLTHTANSVGVVTSPAGEAWLLVTNDHFIARRPPPTQHLAAVLAARLPAWTAPAQPALAKLLSHRRAAAVLAQIETALSLPGGWVAAIPLPPPATAYSASGAAEAASGPEPNAEVEVEMLVRGIPFTNGIAVSPDGASVVVAATMGPYVTVYDLTFATKAAPESVPEPVARPVLTYSERIYMPMLPDNLHFTPGLSAASAAQVEAALPAEAHGSPRAAEMESARVEAQALKTASRWGGAALVVAGHPAPRAVVRYAQSADARPPGSWVVAVSGTWRAAVPDARRAGLRKWKSTEDAAPVPAARRAAAPPAWDWSIKTLYQANEGNVGGAGVSTSTAALWDPRHAPGAGQGNLIVTGLYARGAMMCKHVGLE